METTFVPCASRPNGAGRYFGVTEVRLTISIRITVQRLRVLQATGFVFEPGRLVFEPGGFVCESHPSSLLCGADVG